MRIRSVAWMLALALVTAAASVAQVQKGSITVTALDADGAVLPGVSVSVVAADSLTRRGGVTDDKGTVELPALDPSVHYTVSAELEGFTTGTVENILVRSGQNSPVRVALALAGVTESITVTSEAPIVDVTSAQTGQDVTLELTESLPTGRSYQSYLQLVPGVMPSMTGNPAARSGTNFNVERGEIGQSGDNVYYIEGINVTDRYTGTFGANMNTEIIQEQSVLTGGLSAEYQGAPGLVSNVATKSGGNQFSGSLNYFFQDDSLVGDNEHNPNAAFSTYDSAFTLGGPVVHDKAWFFASYRVLNREDDVTNPAGAFLRTVTTDQDQAFGKLSWNISQNDLLSVTYLTDPFERDGSDLFTTLNNRSVARQQGGERYNGRYTRVFGNLVLEANGSHHEGEVSNLPAVTTTRNNALFLRADFPGSTPPAASVQLGGAGTAIITERSNDGAGISADWSLATGYGTHTLKMGLGRNETAYFEDSRILTGARYDSLDARYAGRGITAGQISARQFTAIVFDSNNTSDVFGSDGTGGLVGSINRSANRAAHYAVLDTNHDGALTPAELSAGIVFSSTAGNPNGLVNYARGFERQSGAFEVGSEGDVAFLQDLWQVGRFSVNLGVRAERTSMLNSDGLEMFEFEYEYAPRASVAYDVFGDGRHRVTAFYGRYYDPIRDRMNDFAGQQNGPVVDEQVFVNGEWLTYRVRGGRQDVDAAYAPTTKVPYTDEYMLGYKADLGRSMSVEAVFSRRETRDILEDFDMCLYANDFVVEDEEHFNCYPGDRHAPGTLFLGDAYFGFGPDNPRPVTNFMIATLPDSERNYDIAELVFRRRLANSWQFLASYTYTNAEGNALSDAQADFAGDDLQFDPRAPNNEGTLEGAIEHLAKFAGSYQFPIGLEVGAAYTWNSGVSLSESFLASNRYLYSTGPAFDFNGTTYNWTEEGVVGALKSDSYGTFDVRVSYDWSIGDAANVDLFVDVFNVLDDQAVVTPESLSAGAGGVAFGEGKAFVDPRRFYLGARVRF